MTANLGPYTIVKQLAAGERVDILLGRADADGTERYVVLQRLRSRDPHLIERFLVEAHLAAQLQHPNIAQICDVGEFEGECYVAREYVHGDTLQDVLAEIRAAWVRLPLGHAIAIVSAAAAGAYHASEILGGGPRPPGAGARDLEPSKILVGHDGSIRLVDLGMARAWTLGERSPGELSYVSPEQRAGGDGDARSDVYSLGAVLYELVTMNRLFKEDGEPSAMDPVVAGQATIPLALRAHAPDGLWAIIMRALSSDPDRRYQTADELRAALDLFGRGIASTESPATLAAYLRKQLGERPDLLRQLQTSDVLVTPVRPSAQDLRPSLHDLGPSADDVRPSVHDLRPSVHDLRPSVHDLRPSVHDLRPSAHDLRPSAQDMVRRGGGSVVQPSAVEPEPQDISQLSRPSSMVMPGISQDLTLGAQPSTPAPVLPPVNPPTPAVSLRRSPTAALAMIGVPLVLAGVAAAWWFGASHDQGAPAAPATVADTGTRSPMTSDPGNEAPGVPQVVAVGNDPPAARPGAAPSPAGSAGHDTAGEHERAAAAGHRLHEAPPRRIAKVEPVARPRKPSEVSSEPSSAPPQAAPPVTAPAPAAGGSAAATPHIAVPAQEHAEAPSAPLPPPPSAPAPAPTAPPVAAPPPSSEGSGGRLVTAAVLDASRIAGDNDIVPDEATRAEIRRSGVSTIAGAYKICVAADGKIVSVGVLKSTGYPAYDTKIQSTILGTWRYRPVVVDGKPGPVCSGAKVTLWSSTTKWGNRPTWH